MIRGGYGVSYNAGSYAAIARQLVSQPPFAVTNTSIGALNAAAAPRGRAVRRQPPTRRPTTTASTRTTSSAACRRGTSTSTARFGVPWTVGVNYTHTRGSSLDIVRAPNRDPDGLRIAGVQPFTWQSAEGVVGAPLGLVPPAAAPGRAASAGRSPTRSPGRATTRRQSAAAAGRPSSRRTTGPRRRMGALELRPASPVRATVNVELPFGAESPMAGGRRTLGRAARGLVADGDVQRGRRDAADGARPRRVRTSRRARTARCAPTTTARRSPSTIRRSIASSTPSAFAVPTAGTVRQLRPQHHHRTRFASARTRSSRRDVRLGGTRTGVDPAPGQQPAQHGQLRGHRHLGELADVRPGPQRPADALRAAQSAVPVLTAMTFRRAAGALCAAIIARGDRARAWRAPQRSRASRRRLPRRAPRSSRSTSWSATNGRHRARAHGRRFHDPRGRPPAADSDVRLRGDQRPRRRRLASRRPCSPASRIGSREAVQRVAGAPPPAPPRPPTPRASAAAA